jgi:glycerol-3-phosphate acyltransferase PlsX
MPTIAVDAMGGEFAPDAIVRGVADVSVNTDIQCILVGNERRIQKALDSVSYNAENIEVVPAAEVIGTAEDAKEAVRRKRKASLLEACALVEQGRADAAVSAGNADAAVLACLKYLPLIDGVRKVAMTSVYPRQIEFPGQDYLALALDVGATVRCTAEDLVQFAIMGSAYARRVSKLAAPRVGLLNVGRPENAGGAVLAEAHRRLRGLPSVNFVGNVEGHELSTGRADVIVCEGLLGNVVLKLLEGLAEVVVDLTAAAAERSWRWRTGMALLSTSVGRLREMTDYASYGGAPILGFQSPFIKAHARSTEKAIGNAVKVAAKAVRDEVVREIGEALSRED